MTARSFLSRLIDALDRPACSLCHAPPPTHAGAKWIVFGRRGSVCARCAKEAASFYAQGAAAAELLPQPFVPTSEPLPHVRPVPPYDVKFQPAGHVERHASATADMVIFHVDGEGKMTAAPSAAQEELPFPTDRSEVSSLAGERFDNVVGGAPPPKDGVRFQGDEAGVVTLVKKEVNMQEMAMVVSLSIDAAMWSWIQVHGQRAIVVPSWFVVDHTRIVFVRREDPQYSTIAFDMPARVTRISRQGLAALGLPDHALVEFRLDADEEPSS